MYYQYKWLDKWLKNHTCTGYMTPSHTYIHFHVYNINILCMYLYHLCYACVPHLYYVLHTHRTTYYRHCAHSHSQEKNQQLKLSFIQSTPPWIPTFFSFEWSFASLENLLVGNWMLVGMRPSSTPQI